MFTLNSDGSVTYNGTEDGCVTVDASIYFTAYGSNTVAARRGIRVILSDDGGRTWSMPIVNYCATGNTPYIHCSINYTFYVKQGRRIGISAFGVSGDVLNGGGNENCENFSVTWLGSAS